MAKLTIVNEAGEERVHELRDEVTSVGRSASNSIHITDGKSSRHHFRIERHGEYYKAVDLGSTNGTRINETKITTQLLKPGDVLRVGQTRFTYDGPGEAPAAPAAPPEGDGATVALDEQGAPLVGSAKEASGGEPKYVLDVQEGRLAGQSFNLDLEAVTLGRHKSNTIEVDDDAASNYHAEIKKEPIGWVISDLGSTNGTKVKARNSETFEKIVKTPLSVGMKIKIGKTVLEYRNVGAPAEDDQIFGTVVLDPEKLEDKIAERPSKAGLPKGAAMGLGALALFALVVLAAVKLLPKASSGSGQTAPANPAKAPPDLENKIANPDFSQGTTPLGTPVGWRTNPGQPGIRITIDPVAERNPALPDGQKKGLVIHKAGAQSPSVRSTVEQEDTIAVDPGKMYEFSAALKNDGDGLYGLRVTWLKGNRSLSEHPVVHVGTQEYKDVSALVRPPSWADRVRVGAFAEGREGKTCFDHFSWREKPGAKLTRSPVVRFGGVSVYFEGSKGAFSASSQGQPAIENAQLELVSRDRKAVSSLVSAIAPKCTQQDGKTEYRGLLYDFMLQQTTNYLIGAGPGASGVELRLAVDPQAGGGSQPRMTFDVVGPAARGELELYKGGVPQRLASTARKQVPGISEVLFNVGRRPQLFLSFSRPVTFKTRREGVRRRVQVTFRSGLLSMEIAPENAGEKQRMESKLRDLASAMKKNEWVRGWNLCQEVDGKYRSKFPEAKERVDAARTRIETAARRDREEGQRQVKVALELGVTGAARQHIQTLAQKWIGTPMGTPYKDMLRQLADIEQKGKVAQVEQEAARKLAKAERAFQSGVYTVCISYCKLLLRDYPKTEAAKKAKALLDKARKENGKKKRLYVVITKLKDKAKPYVEAGDYPEAIKVIRNDPDYRKNALDLDEINELLKTWKRKIELRK